MLQISREINKLNLKIWKIMRRYFFIIRACKLFKAATSASWPLETRKSSKTCWFKPFGVECPRRSSAKVELGALFAVSARP